MPHLVQSCPGCETVVEFVWDSGDDFSYCPECDRERFVNDLEAAVEATRPGAIPVVIPDPPAPFAWYERQRKVYLETSYVQRPVGEPDTPYTRFASTADRDWLGDAYEALRVWAQESDVNLEVTRREEYCVYPDAASERALYVYTAQHFRVRRNVGPRPTSYVFTPIMCRCGTENVHNRSTCTNCRTVLYCGACRRHIGSAIQEGLTTVCTGCGHPCSVEGCDTPTHSNFSACAEHGNRFTCRACHTIHEGDPSEVEGVCGDCFDRWCQRCNTGGHDLRMNEAEDMLICENCYRSELGAEPDDPSAVLPSSKLALPTIPGREAIRACGIEIEGADTDAGRGGEIIARALYDAGLSPHHNMQGYHHGSGFVHVEADSSCDWEVVIGPINMAARTDVANLNKVVKLLRKQIVDGNAKLDLRSGLHIHVSAERVGLAQAYNLHRLFAHVEDTMYRLGAAKWPLHRSILGMGRRDYCKIGPVQDSKLRFARTYHGDKYYGLSFTNYFTKMLEGCQCGAAKYGMYEQCTCALKKCTFEFRFFNTTANSRKIHAYLALTQALVAKALSLPEIVSTEEYPEHLFVAERFKHMNPSQQIAMLEEWEPRLRWMVDELPMTPDELQSLRYCVVNSELNKLGDVIDNIIPTTQEVTA